MSTKYNLGTVTAWGEAKEAGYTGTYDQFCKMLATFGDTSEQLGKQLEEVLALKETLKKCFDGETVILPKDSWGTDISKAGSLSMTLSTAGTFTAFTVAHSFCYGDEVTVKTPAGKTLTATISDNRDASLSFPAGYLVAQFGDDNDAVNMVFNATGIGDDGIYPVRGAGVMLSAPTAGDYTLAWSGAEGDVTLDSKQIAVWCDGIVSDTTVTASPVPSSTTPYLVSGTYLSDAKGGRLVFTCDEVPTEDLAVNVDINNIRLLYRS